MDSQVFQFAGSLAAIAAVILLAHFLGFTRGGRIGDEDEARELFQLASGGFDPVEIALDADGRGAIARDGDGRVAVLVPHGGHFVARTLGPDAVLRVERGKLMIENALLGSQPIALQLNDGTESWAEAGATAI